VRDLETCQAKWRPLDRLLVLVWVNILMLVIILANTVSLNIRLHELNLRLSAVSAQFVSISDTIK
jgi:hypothetical protein